MTEYYYPNEVEIKVIDGKRCAFLKPNWKEIREKNERKTSPSVLRDIKLPEGFFWQPLNCYWGA